MMTMTPAPARDDTTAAADEQDAARALRDAAERLIQEHAAGTPGVWRWGAAAAEWLRERANSLCKFCGSDEPGPVGSDGLHVCGSCASEATP